MTRKKIEVRCPYCEGTYAASGLTAHVRARHTEHYQDFQKNRAAIIEKNKIVEGQPAPVVAQNATPEPDPLVETPEPVKADAPEPVEKKDEPVEKQQSGSFLGSVGKALRDW